MGSLSILNAGKGDIKISYSKDNAAEAIRAKRIIKDMLARGYARPMNSPMPFVLGRRGCSATAS